MKLKTSLIGLGCVLLGQLSTEASTLTWSGGSNTWDTGITSNWSNGSSVTWTAGSDAVIGNGGDTAGTITLATTGGVTASSILFNAAGSGNYTLSGTSLILNGSSLSLGTVGGFTNAVTLLTANTNVTINNAFSNTPTAPTTSAWTVNSGVTLTLGGGGTLQSASKNFLTTGLGKIVFSSTGGNMIYNHSGQWDYFNIANTEIANATVNSANFSIAYGGGNATVTLSNAKSVLNVASAIEVGGRANGVTGNGSLIVQSGTVTVAAGKEVRIGGGLYNNGGTGLVDISGGTVTAPIVFVAYKGSSVASVGSLKISGGSLTSGTVMLGGTSGSYLAGSSATLLMTGGTLNLGAGGLASTATPTNLTQSVTLSGGLITATADWTSPLAIALGTTNGNITFQAADGSAVARNITLNGALSGAGGLNKTGAGVLTLGGVNSYTGSTNVSAGQLNVNGSLAEGSTVNVSSGATLAGSGTVNGPVNITGGTVNGTGLKLGTTTFTGNSTLNGTTTASSIAVSSGITSVSSGASASATSVSVANGATLTNNGTVAGAVDITGVLNGTGTINGALTIKGTGELAPGSSPGVTTVTNAFTVEDGAKVSLQIDGTAGAGVTGGFDQIVVEDTGAVTLKTGSILSITLGVVLPTYTSITLIDNQSASAIDGVFSAVYFNNSLETLSAGNTFSDGGLTYQLSYHGIAGGDGIGNDLTLTVVPEPGTWAMMVGGVGMLAFCNRLRRRSGV